MFLIITRAALTSAFFFVALSTSAQSETRNWAPRGEKPVTPTVQGKAPAVDRFDQNMDFITAIAAGDATQDQPATPGTPTRPESRPSSPFDLTGQRSDTADASGSTAVAEDGERIDLSALRYYAAQKNIARVAAEIRRIQMQNPGWTAPRTLFQTGPAVNEQPMWDLYEKGDLDAIYGMIRRYKQATPNYVPSEELVEKLKIAETRRAIARYAKDERWTEVVQAAARVDKILVCPEMQTLWYVGEALGRTGDDTRALGLYRYIMSNCESADERLATLQKASLVLSDAALSSLVALGGNDVASAEQVASFRTDRIRKRVGDAMSTSGGEAVSESDLQQLAAAATNQRSPDDAMLLGWYYFNSEGFDKAREWFDRTLQMEFKVKALEGYILSLRESGASTDAREIALEYHNEDELIAKLFIEIASTDLTGEDPAEVNDEDLQVLSEIIDTHESALGAQSLGWYLYNQGDARESIEWFEKSIGWEATAEGALGLAIARNKIGDTQGARKLATQYGDQFPTLVAFIDRIGTPRARPSRQARAAHQSGRRAQGTNVARRSAPARRHRNENLVRQAVNAYQEGNFKSAIAKLDANRARGGETRDLAMLRGWAHHNSGDYRKSYRIFFQLNKQAPSKKAHKAAVHSWRELMPPRFH